MIFLDLDPDPTSQVISYPGPTCQVIMEQDPDR